MIRHLSVICDMMSFSDNAAVISFCLSLFVYSTSTKGSPWVSRLCSTWQSGLAFLLAGPLTLAKRPTADFDCSLRGAKEMANFLTRDSIQPAWSHSFCVPLRMSWTQCSRLKTRQGLADLANFLRYIYWQAFFLSGGEPGFGLTIRPSREALKMIAVASLL